MKITFWHNQIQSRRRSITIIYAGKYNWSLYKKDFKTFIQNSYSLLLLSLDSRPEKKSKTRECRRCGQHHSHHEPHLYDYVDEPDEDLMCQACSEIATFKSSSGFATIWRLFFKTLIISVKLDLNQNGQICFKFELFSLAASWHALVLLCRWMHAFVIC